MGATGIYIPVHYNYVADLKEKVKFAADLGYTFIMWADMGVMDNLWENIVPIFYNNPEIINNIHAFYVDEPFARRYDLGVTHGLTDTQFWVLVDFARWFDKYIVFSGYQYKNLLYPSQLEHGRQLVANYDRLYNTDMLSKLIVMPDNYFNFSLSELEASFDAIVDWANEKRFPLSNIIPWIAPSCSFDPRTKTDPAQGCSGSWTYSAVNLSKSKGFGGNFFYTLNGIDSDHLYHLKWSLEDYYEANINHSCDYLTYAPIWRNTNQ
jgi:hypothetical protein